MASVHQYVTTVYSFKQDKIWISTENNSKDINYKMRNIFTLFHSGNYTIAEQWRNTHTEIYILRFTKDTVSATLKIIPAIS